MKGPHCHASVVDSPAAPRWEIIISSFPVTHRGRSETCVSASWLLTAAFWSLDAAELLAGKSQRRSLLRFYCAQPCFLARDVIASCRRNALVFGHLNLKNDHVAIAERHLRRS